MQFTFRLLNLFRREKSAERQSSPRHGGGLDVLLSPAQSVAAVHRCVNLLCNSVASMRVTPKQKRGGIFAEHYTGLWYLLNVAPNPYVTSFDFLRQIVANLEYDGNAYVYINRDYSSENRDIYGVKELVLLSRYSVSYDVNTDTYNVAETPYNVQLHDFDKLNSVARKNYVVKVADITIFH